MLSRAPREARIHSTPTAKACKPPRNRLPPVPCFRGGPRPDPRPASDPRKHATSRSLSRPIVAASIPTGRSGPLGYSPPRYLSPRREKNWESEKECLSHTLAVGVRCENLV